MREKGYGCWAAADEKDRMGVDTCVFMFIYSNDFRVPRIGRSSNNIVERQT